MKIVDRYMVKGFVGPLIWCILLFLVMAVIIDIFSFIDDIVKFKIPVRSLVAFYFYYIPSIFLQIVPMAVLLSAIYTLSNLNKHNEIIAMRASGIGLWRVLRPLLLVSLLLCAIVYIVNDRIIPISSRVANMIRRDELESQKRKVRQDKIIENVAIYGTKNRIIFARTYDTENKALSDIIIHEHDTSQNLRSKLTAKTGVWTGNGWKFSKIIVYRIDNSGKILGEPTFYDEKMVPLQERPGDFETREWRPDFMSYRELSEYIENFKGAGTRLIRSLLVDLHYKVAFAFISLIIILVGAPFALITVRGGVLIGIGMSITIGLVYYAAIAISLAFGKAGLLPPIASAWLGNIVFAGIGVYFLNKRA